MLPGAITIISPLVIGFTMGAEPLGSYMAGVAVSVFFGQSSKTTLVVHGITLRRASKLELRSTVK